MKCPYCGAEVTPNTKCEYCDSFVERETKTDSSKSEYHENLEKIIIETAEHLADGLQNASENFEDTVKKAATPENKRFIKKTLITIAVVIVILAICFFLFIFFALRSTFSIMDEMYVSSTTTEDISTARDICSLNDEKAIVTYLDSDGFMTLDYDGYEYNTTLTDNVLLAWLNKHDHSLEGVEVLFSTDNDGHVTSLAMSSHTFFVLQQEGLKYLVLRQGNIFCTTSDVDLRVGSYYDGYFIYPVLKAHVVTPNDGNSYSLFDPVCDAKEMQLFTDPYTGEEFSLPMIYIDDTWYHCSQELYDACTEDQVIPMDVRIDKSMGVIYIAE